MNHLTLGKKWTQAGLLALLAASAGTLQAQSLTIDADQPPAHLLGADEVQRLGQLMDTRTVRLLSPLAPDGSVVLAQADQQMGFWNVNDGSVTLLQGEHAQRLVQSPQPPVWFDAYQLAFLAEQTDAQGETQWHIGIADRRTGEVEVFTDMPLPAAAEIIALAPGGRWLLMLREEAQAGPATQGRRAVPRIRTRMDFGAPGAPVQAPAARLRVPLGQNARPPRAAQPRHLEVTTAVARLELLDLRTGETRPVARLGEGSVLPTAAFDSTGRRLALVMSWFESKLRTEESLTNLVVQEAMGQYPLADNPYHRHNKLVVYDTEAEPMAMRELRLADFPTLPYRFNTTLSWSPSGERLVAGVDMAATLHGRSHPTFYKPQASHYLVFEPGAQAGLVPMAVLDDPALSAPGDDSMPPPLWLSEQEVVFAPLVGMDRSLLKYDFTQRRLAPLAGARPGNLYQWRAVPARREILALRSSVSEPPELWRLNADTGVQRAETALSQHAAQATSVQARPVRFQLANGQQREAYWFAPATAPWPPVQQRVVLWQSGGPGGAMTNEWGDSVENPMSLLPSFGIGVLMVPLQQRPGLNSQMWNQLADGTNFGQVDIDELAEIATQVTERGWSRADQIGISGCSYGGYVSAQSIVRHPQRFAAANAQCSLLDLVTEFQTGFASFIGYLEGASPWMQWSEYLADSPGFHGRSVRTPTLIFHGTKDFLPVGIAENFYADISAAGTPARILRFAGEGHGLREAGNQLYAAQEQISWFRRHLKP